MDTRTTGRFGCPSYEQFARQMEEAGNGTESQQCTASSKVRTDLDISTHTSKDFQLVESS
jgi:hypothetical protein